MPGTNAVVPTALNGKADASATLKPVTITIYPNRHMRSSVQIYNDMGRTKNYISLAAVSKLKQLGIPLQFIKREAIIKLTDGTEYMNAKLVLFEKYGEAE